MIQLRRGGQLLLLLAFLLTPAAADSFDSNGVKIHYVVMGQGQPVVLIHGYYASANANWIAPGLAGELAKSYQVIALDCRGHGQSDKPQQGYGVAMVADVTRLMDHLGVEKAHVVGYSMGGLIALKLAVVHPDRVQSLILGGWGMLETGTPGQRFWERLKFDRSKVPAACIKQWGDLSVSRAEVQGLKMPLSAIVGEKDPNRVLVRKLSQLRPDMSVTIIARAGHLTCVGKPEFRAALVKQLARGSQDAGAK